MPAHEQVFLTTGIKILRQVPLPCAGLDQKMRHVACSLLQRPVDGPPAHSLRSDYPQITFVIDFQVDPARDGGAVPDLVIDYLVIIADAVAFHRVCVGAALATID